MTPGWSAVEWLPKVSRFYRSINLQTASEVREPDAYLGGLTLRSGRSRGFQRRSHSLGKADRIGDVGPMPLGLEDVGVCVGV